MKGQKHWREVWSATPPSPLSISQVHYADMDAFRACVISHVYSDNQIGKEGAEALMRAFERNSSLIHLYLDLNPGADSAACTQCGDSYSF
jgi:hypothetical protein